MLQYAFLQHATPMPSHDTTRGLIQLTSQLGKWSRKVTLLHSTGNNRSFPLPTELRTSTGLSGTFPTRFPLHKGVPSLLYSPSMTSPYQCQFLSSKHQVTVLYFSSLDLGLLCSRVAINSWESFLFSSRKTSQQLCYSEKHAHESPPHHFI
jgi:hypothetical protein